MMHLCSNPRLLLVILAIFTCVGCDGKVCSSNFCKDNEYCSLISLSCDNITCPEVPTCISKRHVCSTSFPYQDVNTAIIQCSESSHVCPVGYKCQSGYCCIDENQPSIDNVLENFGEENAEDDGGFFENNFFPLDVERVQGCKPCGMQRCDLEICIYHEPVKCVADNCSCTISYEDLTGNPVQCEVPIGGIMPIFQDTPDDGTFPIDASIAKALDHINTTDDIETVTPTKEVIVTTTLKKLMTTSPTQVELLTLNTFNNEQRKDITAFVIIGALGALIVLAIMGYAAYKIYTAKITKQNPKPEDDFSDVKVPLKDVSAHNNNEVKISEKLMNSHSTSEDP